MKLAIVTAAFFGLAMASAAPEPAAALKQRGYTCSIGGDDLCSTVVCFLLSPIAVGHTC